MDLRKIVNDPQSITENLSLYIKSFSSQAGQFLEHFGIEEQIQTLAQHNRLYMVLAKFAEIDLHPRSVTNLEMG